VRVKNEEREGTANSDTFIGLGKIFTVIPFLTELPTRNTYISSQCPVIVIEILTERSKK
jgi:hypothetical protein